MKVEEEQGSLLINQEKALKLVGDSHTFQWRTLLILCLCTVVSSFQVTGQSYTFIEPPLLCDDQVKNNFQCQPCPKEDYCSFSKIEVDRSKFKYINLVTQFELWCDKKSLGTIAQSSYFLGSIFGGCIMSYYGDQMGRRKTYIISWILATIGSVGILLSFSIYQYMVFNFFFGYGGLPVYFLNYVIINETSSTEFRQKSSILTLVAWSGTAALTGLVYYYIDRWEIPYAIFVTGPAIILSIMTFTLSETPLYYLRRRQIEDMYKAYDKIALVNKKPLFSETHSDQQETLTNELRLDQKAVVEKSYTMIDLFRFQSLRKPSIGFLVISFTLHLIYYGGQYSISNISGGDNLYEMGVLMGCTEFLAYLLVKQFIHLLPRRKSLIASFILQIVCCMTFLLFGTEKIDCGLCNEAILLIVLACLIRIFNSFGFGFQGLYSNEVYPTCVRSLGTGFLFSAGVLGSFISPYAIALSEFIKVSPYVAIGVISLSGPAAVLLIGETLGKPLKDSILEESSNKRDEYL